jgi:hypothetical protein
MSAWRRKALALFPEHRASIEANLSVYDLFFDFLPLTRQAHRSGSAEFLSRIYGYAEWCHGSADPDLSNSAGVSFYEHLLDESRPTLDELLPHISPDVLPSLVGLIGAMKSETVASDIRQAYPRVVHVYRKNSLHSGALSGA